MLRIFLLFTLFYSFSSHAETMPYTTQIRGKLDRVVDGDTIRIQGYKDSFRLYGINAIEVNQTCISHHGNGERKEINYGRVATEFLKKEILHDDMDTIITCDFNATGYYQRPLATCYAQNQIYKKLNLNKLMVFRGRAFADHKYAKDREYLALEAIAKKNNWGMWRGNMRCKR